MCLAFSLQWRRGSGGNEGNGCVGAVFAGGHGAVSRIYLTLLGNGDASRSVGGVDSGKGGLCFPIGGGVDGDKGGMACGNGNGGCEGGCAGLKGFEVGDDSSGFLFGGSMDGDQSRMVGGYGYGFPVCGDVNGDEGGMVGGNWISSNSAELERIEGVFTARAEDRWRRDDGALGWRSW